MTINEILCFLIKKKKNTSLYGRNGFPTPRPSLEAYLTSGFALGKVTIWTWSRGWRAVIS